MTINTFWTSTLKRCTDPAHQPFIYWRSGEQEYICDLCNWETAWRGGPGWIGAYPVEVQRALRRELLTRGVQLVDN